MTHRKTGPTARRLPYMPGLDGLRGIAVLAVIAYHSALPWSDGGFLGVEVFFVLSGYLITALLMLDIQVEGRIRFRHFWLRRARRLLPALWLLLLILPAAARVLAPETLPRLREDTLAALAYVLNWVYIFREVPYFEHFGRPPLLQHLWSLAIEEQFYLIWPLLVAFAASRGRGQSQNRLLALTLGLAFLSVGWRWLLYQPYEDTARVYYGTDTRAAGLLFGAALALLWPPRRNRSRLAASARFAAEVIGWSGFFVLLGLFARCQGYLPALYRGGFVVTDVATLAVLLAASRTDTSLGR
ncbi:MAG: acyltransferase, partial [Chloroflexi bacterium]|nr:acyltransferase [Chloroflexota bacterium]